jgi:hypothetical protein
MNTALGLMSSLNFTGQRKASSCDGSEALNLAATLWWGAVGRIFASLQLVLDGIR